MSPSPNTAQRTTLSPVPATRIKIENVRIAFPELFTAKTVQGQGKPGFSGTFLFQPTHPAVAKIKAAMLAAAIAKWGAKAQAQLEALELGDRTALHDGKRKPEYQGFPGNLYLTARSQTKPLVINANRAPLVEADGVVYSGCYVHASFDFWAQDNSYGKRINAQLRGVQFFRDGDAFSGGRPADPEEFEDLSDQGDGESLL